MKILCECGGEEFLTDVPARMEVFVNPQGKISPRLVGEIVFLPDMVHPAQKFTCTSCGKRAEVEHP